MSFTVDYLPIATAVGANVDSQVDFAGSGYQEDGFSVGLADPTQANKCWRQSSMMAAALANFISNTLSINVLDDGDLSALITNLTDAIASASQPKVVPIAFSATPVFDASLGNPLVVVFELALTGNVTSSTLINVKPGQIVAVTVIEPSGGGDTFVAPANLPMAAIDTAANARNTQAFMVLADSSLVPIGPLTVD